MSLSFLDFIFPKRCVSCKAFGSYICTNCFGKIEYLDKPVCPVCQRQAIGGKTHPGCRGRYTLDGLVVAARYRGVVKQAILRVKYKWEFDIEKILVDIMVFALWKFDLPNDLILVPVPLSSVRKKWRGFNQSEILARTLAVRFGQNFGNVLVRTRNTRPQVGLSKDERKKNISGAFALNKFINRNRIIGGNFALIDDVYTTGATMQECAKVLKRTGAKSVWGMVVALG